MVKSRHIYGRKEGGENTKAEMSFRIIKQSIINPGQKKKYIPYSKHICDRKPGAYG